MKKRWMGLILACLMLFSSPGARALTEDQRAQADRHFAGVFERAGVVSGGILVSQRSARVYSFFWGGQSKSAAHPVTENTVFKVASVSKLISAVGVMQLVEAGKLDLDAPLLSPLTSLPIRNPRHPDAAVTLRQAMSHTTSLQPSAPYIGTPKWDQLDEGDKTYFFRSAPGTVYQYANINGGILTSETERVTGQNFNDYMTENVFKPLGINASYAAHLLPDPSLLANTYKSNGTVYMSGAKYVETDKAEFDPSCDPAAHYRTSVGGLYISLVGLEKIGVALAGDGSVDGVRLLSPASVRLMRQDQSLLPGSSVFTQSPYGLCVYRIEIAGRTWYGHQGRWEGLLADLFWEPESQTVIVFLMNGLEQTYNAGKEISTRPERAVEYVSDWIREDENASFIVSEE